MGTNCLQLQSCVSISHSSMGLLQVSAVAAPLLLALCVLSLLIRSSWKTKKTKTSRKKTNSPPPVAGNIFHLLINIPRLQDFLTNIAHKHKTFRFTTLPTCGDHIYTVDPANVEYILKTNFANYGKGKFFYDILTDLLGDGIFAVDGEKWGHQRKIASYEFSTKVLRDYSGAVFKTNASELARVISEAACCNRMIDLQDLLRMATMDSILKVGFGVESKILTGTNEKARVFVKAFDDTNRQLVRRLYDVSWKIKRYLNIGTEAKLKKDVKVMDDFVYELIDIKKTELAKHQDESIKEEDIMSRFLIEREKDPKKVNDQYLRDIMLSFLLAGRETTAETLAWFFYMLCKHPDVEEKVAKEVREATNTRGKVPIREFPSHLTEEALKKMQYLLATLTETLRLYPAVPQDPKQCFQNDTLPDGFEVRQGDRVFYHPYAMGRMKFLWGEDADEFKPQRWLNADGVFQAESPFKFTAFQAGPRICLGKEFAYRQMTILAATLLYYFKFKLWDERRPVHYKATFTLHIDGGLSLSALER